MFEVSEALGTTCGTGRSWTGNSVPEEGLTFSGISLQGLHHFGLGFFPKAG